MARFAMLWQVAVVVAQGASMTSAQGGGTISGLDTTSFVQAAVTFRKAASAAEGGDPAADVLQKLADTLHRIGCDLKRFWNRIIGKSETEPDDLTKNTPVKSGTSEPEPDSANSTPVEKAGGDKTDSSETPEPEDLTENTPVKNGTSNIVAELKTVYLATRQLLVEGGEEPTPSSTCADKTNYYFGYVSFDAKEKFKEALATPLKDESAEAVCKVTDESVFGAPMEAVECAEKFCAALKKLPADTRADHDVKKHYAYAHACCMENRFV